MLFVTWSVSSVSGYSGEDFEVFAEICFMAQFHNKLGSINSNSTVCVDTLIWGCFFCLLPGGVPGLGGTWSGRTLVTGGAWSRGVPGGDPPQDGYCCGWYISYWKAFLFNEIISLIPKLAMLTFSMHYKPLSSNKL